MTNAMTKFIEGLKQMGDVFSISTLIGTLVGWLPHIASLFTVIWAILRVYEMKTVQDWLKKRKEK